MDVAPTTKNDSRQGHIQRLVLTYMDFESPCRLKNLAKMMAKEDCFRLVKLGVITPNKIKKEEVDFLKNKRTISNDATINSLGKENEGLPSKKPNVQTGPTPDVTLSSSGEIATSLDVPTNVKVVGSLHGSCCGRSC